MLTVAPDGTKNANGKQFWNATDACCNGPGAQVDDSGYLDAVIKEVEANYNVDPKRVFIVGHSNGGFMAYRMACDHADTIAAVVSLEAATYADPRKCSPSVPVATLEIHGTADDTINYDGGKILGHRYPGAVATTKMWAKYDGCRLVRDRPAPSTARHRGQRAAGDGHRLLHRLQGQRPRRVVDGAGRRAHPEAQPHLRRPGGRLPPRPSEAVTASFPRPTRPGSPSLRASVRRPSARLPSNLRTRDLGL